MPTWTSEQVASLAPDTASVTAARALATPRPWSSTGYDDRAVWGKVRSYSTSVDLGGPAFRCTCPSRKIPCKHALGLLMLWASSPETVPRSEAPADVEEWLAARAARATRAAARPGDHAVDGRRRHHPQGPRSGQGQRHVDPVDVEPAVHGPAATAQASPPPAGTPTCSWRPTRSWPAGS